MARFRKITASKALEWDGQHRFEHWYRDNTVYFITARIRDRQNAFKSDDSKAIFWDRFDFYTKDFGFTPWVTSLLDNHYHTQGYLKLGENLGPMIQQIHGSVAKLVNDTLPTRISSFWCDAGRRGYSTDVCGMRSTAARRFDMC